MKKFICFLKKSYRSSFFKFSVESTRFTVLLLIVICNLLFITGSYAQNMKEYKDVIGTLNKSSDKAVQTKAEHLRSLVYDLQPELFILNNRIKNSSESLPVCLTADAGSINTLYGSNTLFEKVELITILIDSPADINEILDLSKLQNFPNIKYIQFLCSYECNPALLKLSRMNSETGITVFYQISIPQ